MIQIDSIFPDCVVTLVTADGQHTVHTSQLLAAKKSIIFIVPGAFTPTCSASHLPGFVTHADGFFAKGIDQIICMSVNDAFVMQAWRDAHQAQSLIMMADGAAELTKLLGLELDTGSFGGVRARRSAMIVEDGVVRWFEVEQPKQFELTKAEHLLSVL